MAAGILIQGISIIIVRPSQPIISPRPSCSPAVTDCGINRTTLLMRPLAPYQQDGADIIIPPATVAAGDSWPVSSTAEMALIGCTAMGS